MQLDKNMTAVGTTLLILKLLGEADMYGYQIISELQRRSNHVFDFKEGTLYPVLHGLERDGLVESYSVTAENGRARKYYRLTKDGARRLEKKKEEWAAFSVAMGGILEGEA